VVGGVRELRQRLARQAPGQGIVGAVERRAGHRISHRQNRDAGGLHPLADIGVRTSVVAIVDKEVELAGNCVVRIGERVLPVAVIVVEHHLHWQAPCREQDARSDLRADDAQPFDASTGVLREIGETDAVTALLAAARRDGEGEKARR
jgi:hypothetical protein